MGYIIKKDFQNNRLKFLCETSFYLAIAFYISEIVQFLYELFTVQSTA